MDIIEKLIVGDVITRSQYYDSRKGDDDSALKRLMLAILRDALECLSGGVSGSAGSLKKKEARDAAAWISDRTDESLFSFTCVCETLRIHPEALRESLNRWLNSGLRLTRRSPVVPAATRRPYGSSAGSRT